MFLASEQKRPGANRPPGFVPESPLQKRGLWESYFLQGIIGKTHTQNLQILRDDTLGATCSAGPFCLLPSFGSPNPYSGGRGCLGEGRLGLPGQVWELRFLLSFPSFPGEKTASPKMPGKAPGSPRHPQPSDLQLVEKVRQYTSNLYGSTPPICIAILSWLLSFEERKTLQYTSHSYCSTPPICTAVCSPFVRQYFWKSTGGWVTGTFLKKIRKRQFVHNVRAP